MKKRSGLLLVFSSLALLFFSSFFALHFTVALEQKKGSNISCEVSKKNITYGESVSISGRLTDLFTGVQGIINITYSEDNGTTWKLLSDSQNILEEADDDVWTNQTGYYGPISWRPSIVPHNLLVKASYGGDEVYSQVESPIRGVVVMSPPELPLEIFNHRSYVWSNNTLWIVGEVVNTGTTNLEQVEMTAVYYDQVGTILGTEKCFTQLLIISPEQKAPFINFAGASYSNPINASSIASYEIVVRSYSTTTAVPYEDLLIVGEESFFDEEDNFHTKGVIKNNGTIPVESIVPVVTFYDSNDKVVDAWFDLPYPSRLDPNQTTTFDIELDKSRLDAIGEIDHYLLQVDYYLERNSSKIIFSISSEGEDENTTVSVYREGEQIKVSGHITPEAGTVLVTIILTKPDNTTSIVRVITTPEGYFNYTFIPEDPGAWSVTANWPGSLDIEGATSVPTSFTIEKTIIRKTPSLIIAAIATTIGVVIPVGFTSITGQFFNSIISKLPDSLIEYLQTIFDNIRALPRLKTGEKLTQLIQGDMFIAGFSMLISTIVFGYVAANGLPDFFHISVLSVIIPIALIAATIDRIAGELTEFSILKMFKLQGELEIWYYGIIAFLVSGFLFRIPFSTPVRFIYEDEEIVEKTRVFIKILDRILALPLLIPFSIMIMLGFRLIGDLGILMCLTKIFYSLVPVKPMVGKDIFDYNRRVWLSIFAPMMILYYTWILNILPWTVYFTAGLIATLVGISLIIIFHQSKTKIMLKPNSIMAEHSN